MLEKVRFYKPRVILFPFDLSNSCLVSGPHCVEGFPDKLHFALLYLPPASKSRLLSHLPLCLYSSVNFGRKKLK